MYSQILVFIVSTLVFLTVCRLALMLWQRKRVAEAGHPLRILVGGLRIDAHLIGIMVVLPLALAPWLGPWPGAIAANGVWLVFAWSVICLLEFSTPQYVIEYDTRPNQLYVIYLKYPREVFSMLFKEYRLALFLGVAALLAMVALGWRLLGQAWLFPEPSIAWWLRPLLTLAGIAACVLAIRGTLKHRPINPSTVAFCGDGLVNALALNSLYNVMFSVYSLKNEASASRAYGDMDDSEIQALVREASRIAGAPSDPAIPTLHRQQPAERPKKKRHLVLIVEESLGAQFVGHLGGSGCTPELDRLAPHAWTFRQAYATGTRSVRGLEALSAGFPPSLSQAALRLPGAQSRFFTLAQLLGTQGYRNGFVYGGEAHFDNMKAFFLGNGFTELYDLKTFDNPAFVGTWGASDEDMFNRVHAVLEQAGDEPCFILAFSVSNHSPWEYPQGRITPVGDPATVGNTVRYADWAIGRFFDRARQSAYWDDTVFLVTADHDVRVGGKQRIPLRHFHIPALILGGPVRPRFDERVVSQIDFPVTLLSLLGIEGEHPMIGFDLTDERAGGRALMQYGDVYGLLQERTLTILEPGKAGSQYLYQGGDDYQPIIPPDPAAIRKTLAHALWPQRVYRDQAYTLPHLRKKR
ncbi:LTA synthase family protein [Bordetella hinzii]|uniref:LTA synthase family protein n=1 Tax=Bordetella hinzii TaxID=103855 RepID=A0AAN1VEW7_9BORD|nr:LTA synthase family protein [Bordetella hinzii]AKQ58776.1 Lipoteichoic acid synthase 1 [Bordetella hinzii]AZW15942.1 LTA synthase family protein [Bordetella hinzii]KCB49438.1 arylsulfatase [Bordetella hinzii 4161]KCB52648.1 arylsulfatase [Bordetella hinzii 1277]KXA74168.1 sulfatase [Bordetella hinzii LMG 13501]